MCGKGKFAMKKDSLLPHADYLLVRLFGNVSSQGGTFLI